MAHACHDASQLTDLEADRLYGLLIATLPEEEVEDLEGLVDRLDAFAHEVDIACKFGGAARPA